jgi:hypothetical protein
VEKFFPKVPNFYPVEDDNPFFYEKGTGLRKREKASFRETKKAEPSGPASPFTIEYWLNS